jgi:cytochrome o ubiquinol oxidase subunit 2
MRKARGITLALVVVGCLIFGGFLLLRGLDIPVLAPSGEVANHEKNILLVAIGLSAIVVVPVYTLLVVFAIRYRASNKSARYAPEWGENKRLETLWWGIPIVIISILAVITYQTSYSLDPYKKLEGGKSLEVQVVALQWKWLFLYPAQKVATLNQLPLPINRPVHFSLTANAPMSSFWIPALGTQIYTMGGMDSQLNLKPTKMGNFTGYTTNINGKGYSNMTFTTKVMSSTGFDNWVQNAAASKEQMNMAKYTELSVATPDTQQRTYRLDDSSMFDSILGQSMGHGAHSTEPTL